MTLGINLVHRDFMHLGPASEASKLQNHYLKGSFTYSLWEFSQFIAKFIAATDEKDLYKNMTKLCSMVRGST